MSLDEDLRAVAAQQYRLVSRRQARALGARTSGLRSRVRHADWEEPTPRVLRLIGAPAGIRQDLMLAVLDAGPGAVVSHRTAAALWRLPGFVFATLEVSRPRSRSRHPCQAATAHHPRRLGHHHLTERYGIPVTTLARTVFDVAGGIHPGRLDRLLDTVVARSPSVLVALRAVHEELAEHGRRGSAALGAALATRPDGYVATASGLEARFARILGEAGEPPLDRQVDVGGHEWVGRVDFVDRAGRILVEVDSDLHHSSALDRAHDRRRDEALLAAGWAEVVRVTEDEVWRRPEAAVARIRAARRRSRPLLVAGIDPDASVSATRTATGAGT